MRGEPLSTAGKNTVLTDGQYEEPEPSRGRFRFYNDCP